MFASAATPVSFDQVVGVDPDTLDADGVRAMLIACRRLRSQLDGAEARLIAAGQRLGAFKHGGAFDAPSWMRDHLGSSVRDARTRTELAERLDSLPETTAALASGDITLEHAAVVARTADERHREAVVADEASLVAQAKATSADRFAKDVRAFVDRIDADGGLVRCERLRARRSASMHVRPDGMGVTVLELDPESHAWWRSALGTFAEQLWRADHPKSNEPMPVEERSNRQRLADAAIEMARRALATGPAAAREVRPVVIARFDRDVLVEQLRIVDAEITGVGPVPAATARRLACDCDVLPVVLGGKREVLDLGRSARLPNRAVRRALLARDIGCRWVGCDRPHEWCEAHHIVEWETGGVTALWNLVLLCSRHHHMVHEGGWRLTGTADRITIRRPDGTVFHCDPPHREARPPKPRCDARSPGSEQWRLAVERVAALESSSAHDARSRVAHRVLRQ
jgi:hypothetical protein